MAPTTEDPNRTCWNCKHFAPEDRQTSPDGECRISPPRYDGVVSPWFFFPAALGDEWCGNWERNASTVGDMPERALREEETPLPLPIVLPTMNNTVESIRSFAEENNIEIIGTPNKAELLEEVLKIWEENNDDNS